MAHVAKQIRSWATAALTGYGALPTPIDGQARQADAGDPVVVIGYGVESIDVADIHAGLERVLQLRITAAGADLDAVDALVVDIEKGIAAASATYPGNAISLIDREYDEVPDLDVRVATCICTYRCDYYTASNDPENAL